MSKEAPDVSDLNLAPLPERPFPRAAEFRVAFSGRARGHIHRHARENTQVEICGVLLGDVCRDADGPYLLITDAIRGEHAATQEGQVMFTHDTWAHINTVKDDEFPEKLMVGWYHTHPNYGIFLSQQDVFIHANFFNQPWHVAYVVDPVREDEGVFIWRDGQPEVLKDFWVGGRRRSAREAPPPPGGQGPLLEKIERLLKDVIPPKPSNLFQILGLLGLLGLAALVGWGLVMGERRYAGLAAYLATQEHLLTNLAQSKAKATEIREDAADLQNLLKEHRILAPLNLQVTRKGEAALVSGQVHTRYQQELAGRTLGAVPGVSAVDLREVKVTHTYAVAPGETLSDIAARLYGREQMWREIYRLNRAKIKDPHRLPAALTLRLPAATP